MDQPCSDTLSAGGLQAILWMKNSGYLLWKDNGNAEVEVGEG